jgi:putative hemolysin
MIPLAVTLGLLGGCASSISHAETPRALQGMPNPSVKKCLEDGYQIEHILTHGIPTGSYCVDAQSGKKCEAWAYFHGECRLPPASKDKK